MSDALIDAGATYLTVRQQQRRQSGRHGACLCPARAKAGCARWCWLISHVQIGIPMCCAGLYREPARSLWKWCRRAIPVRNVPGCRVVGYRRVLLPYRCRSPAGRRKVCAHHRRADYSVWSDPIRGDVALIGAHIADRAREPGVLGAYCRAKLRRAVMAHRCRV